MRTRGGRYRYLATWRRASDMLAPRERHVVYMMSTYIAGVASLNHPEHGSSLGTNSFCDEPVLILSALLGLSHLFCLLHYIYMLVKMRRICWLYSSYCWAAIITDCLGVHSITPAGFSVICDTSGLHRHNKRDLIAVLCCNHWSKYYA